MLIYLLLIKRISSFFLLSSVQQWIPAHSINPFLLNTPSAYPKLHPFTKLLFILLFSQLHYHQILFCQLSLPSKSYRTTWLMEWWLKKYGHQCNKWVIFHLPHLSLQDNCLWFLPYPKKRVSMILPHPRLIVASVIFCCPIERLITVHFSSWTIKMIAIWNAVQILYDTHFPPHTQ